MEGLAMIQNSRFFPWFVVCAAMCYLAIVAYRPAEDPEKFQVGAFAALPVQEGGRIMPMDSFFRARLLQFGHKQSASYDVKNKKSDIVEKTVWMTPAEWGLEVLCDVAKQDAIPHDAKIFRIDYDGLLAHLDLKGRTGFRYALSEFANNKKFQADYERFHEEEPNKNDPLDMKSAELVGKVRAYLAMLQLADPQVVPPEPRSGVDQAVADLPWRSLAKAQHSAQEGNRHDLMVLDAFRRIIRSYATNKPHEFNAAVEEYREQLRRIDTRLVDRADLEVFYNHFAPCLQCAYLFGVVLVMALFSWIGWTRPLNQAAFALGIVVLAVYSWTIVTRVIISGYAPVTNLYSSAVFIGWGCAALGLLLEWITRNGIGSIVAAVTGGCALIIAHNLVEGDTMGKLVAVLESNFWLSTHVTCITLGYTATFVAGFLGLAYVILGVFTDKLRGDSGVMLTKVMYGVICFAMFLSFVGTVLGGIWADQSWGRFWGWDPKENGALLIVLWNALILHARWGGVARSRGVAQLAICGNIVTAWSWFGTNLLGVGLHTYGFMKGAMIWLVVFAVTQMIVVLIALIPQRNWRSFRAQTPRVERPQMPPNEGLQPATA
jgi:ABC-type transport system involved in cytochrome c biogenesis permease subunit